VSNVGAIMTNAVTAVCTAAVTSMFWIAAYSGSRDETKSVSAPVSQSVTMSLQGDDGTADAPRPTDAKLVHGPTGLAIPVLGIRQSELVDTFTQARAAGHRVHDAIDIMAPAGSPVVAAAPGIVEKLYFSYGGGGITAYVRSPDRHWTYYYAHLRDYARGLKEGEYLKQGDPIGSVGSTGNASPSGPHLHFAVNKMEPGQRWWQGTPINPYPLLAGTKGGP
jgi:murein DD-endopeptidase MepM/ murein hydrolase activator NlpD